MLSRTRALLVAALAALVATVAIPAGAWAGTTTPGVPAPKKGVWFGVSLDWGSDTLSAYSQRLGHRPAAAVTFSGFPMSTQEKGWLDATVSQAKDNGSILLLTLEPKDGLAKVTPALATSLAKRLARYNKAGVRIIVRFAHEMNGSWYAWGQQPVAYKKAFRTVAKAVHLGAPRSAMMWAPNYGGGYPFHGGAFEPPQPGSPDFAALDTDGDGSLTSADDPYRPYWPGKAYVDWVGMSLYHWGAAYPWGENEVPEDHKFLDLLHGTYDGANGDETAVPDFYADYAAGMSLPLAITETAAFYVPGAGGADELAVKSGWWSQVFAASNAADLPWLKLIDWFEWDKFEQEVQATVDWTVTNAPAVQQAFTAALPSWVRFAP